MNNSILKRIYIGIKRGYETPTLPDNLLILHNNPYIRCLRFTYISSTLLILAVKAIEIWGLDKVYFIFLSFYLVIAMLYLVYSLFINYHRIKHIKKVLKSDKLDIHL
jgi:hypothetical protein